MDEFETVLHEQVFDKDFILLGLEFWKLDTKVYKKKKICFRAKIHTDNNESDWSNYSAFVIL